MPSDTTNGDGWTPTYCLDGTSIEGQPAGAIRQIKDLDSRHFSKCEVNWASVVQDDPAFPWERSRECEPGRAALKLAESFFEAQPYDGYSDADAVLVRVDWTDRVWRFLVEVDADVGEVPGPGQIRVREDTGEDCDGLKPPLLVEGREDWPGSSDCDEVRT